MMNKINKALLTLTLVAAGTCCHAQSFTLELDNHAQAMGNSAAESVYAYPDARLGYYIQYVHYNTCPTNATCSVPAGQTITISVSKIANAPQTIICLSTQQPSGSYNDCAANACEVAVNYTTGSLQPIGGGDCSQFNFNSNNSFPKNGTYTVSVK